MKLTRNRPQPPVQASATSEQATAMTVVPRPATPAPDVLGTGSHSVPAAPARARVKIDDLAVEDHGGRLGELLVRERVASREQVVAALLQQEHSPKRLGALLVELGAVDERDVARLVATRLGLPLADLRQQTPNADAVALLPESSARAMRAVPMSLSDEGVAVVVSDPSEELRLRLEAEIRRPVRLLVASPSEVARAITGNYRALSGVGAQVEAFEARDAVRRAAIRAETAAAANDDAPVVQVVQLIIAQGMRDRASDIHIEPQDDRIRVRYRIDGALHDVLSLPGSMGAAIASRIKIMGGMNIVERRRPQDGQIALELDGRGVDIRVSTTATIWGEKVVMRLLDKSRSLYRLSDLGMTEDTAKRFSELIHSPSGMVICAGPTGSGKTTTLYGSLSELNQPDRNITTIEDPVEYTFPSINQIQINESAGVTFSDGLRSILRQDPDVILVGEVRDADTARIAVQSALTGHFVLSSLHATDSVSALHRLLDMGIEPFLVASSVTAVIAQRLVRRICRYCHELYEPSTEELGFLRSVLGRTPPGLLARGAGCTFCAGTGYLERIGVYELLTVTDPVKRLVLERAPHEEFRQIARMQGMRTLRDEAVGLVEAGITTVAEVLRSVYMAGG
jgi:type IV pilus assembly protein PilB